MEVTGAAPGASGYCRLLAKQEEERPQVEQDRGSEQHARERRDQELPADDQQCR